MSENKKAPQAELFTANPIGNIDGLSAQLETAISELFAYAASQHHEWVTTEHLLFALADEPTAREVLEACNANIDELKSDLTKFIDEKTSRIGLDGAEGPQPTLGFQRVLQRAVMQTQSIGSAEVQKVVTGARILVALFGEKDSHAVYYLNKKKITRLDIVNFIAHGIRKDEPSPEENGLHLPIKIEYASLANLRGSIEILRRDLGSFSSPQKEKPKLFISYAHIDVAVLNRLLVHLKPLERANTMICWSDQRIRTGAKWREELQRNLDESVIAILLISADFLASEFIVNDELRPLLIKAESNGLKILPVILKPCGFRRDPILSTFQAANDPTSPLLGMSMIDQEALYDKIAEEVAVELQVRQQSVDRQNR